MKILLISSYGEHTAIGYRLIQDGHQVKLYIKDPNAEDVGKGLIERINEWPSEIDWADLIVFDDTHNSKEAEWLRSLGKPVIGGTEYTDRLENDRGFGQEEFKKSYFDIIPSYTFKTFDEAKQFINKHPTKYVIKLNGKASDDKSTTYVGKEEDASDLLAVLNHFEEKLTSTSIKTFELQEVIDGVEIGIGGAFNGTDFIEPIEINFEHKKFATGNLGQNTGEMGTSMFFVTKDHPLYKITIAKMIPKLQGYHGMFDINFIFTKDFIYPLEPTCRFGFPAVTLQMSVINDDYGQRLMDIASGKNSNSKCLYKFVVGINGCVPPFPFDTKEVFENMSKDNLVIIKDISQIAGHYHPDGIHPIDVYEKDNNWYITGLEGIPIVATGVGDTMIEAKNLAYTRLANVITPNLFYRTDISDRWEIDEPRLVEWGYLPDLFGEFRLSSEFEPLPQTIQISSLQ